MTHIAVIVSPYALTPVQDSGRIRFYIIRILVRIPDSKVCQCSRRFHRDKCTGFCLRSTLHIHHQDGSFHRLAFHRSFPFSTYRHTGRNDQLSGNTITTSRNKQYTTTAIFAQFSQCRLESIQRIFHTRRIGIKVSSHSIGSHPYIFCRIFIRRD